MARIEVEKPFNRMSIEEVQALYGTVERAIQVVAKQELEDEFRRSGVRPFTLLVDGKRHVPLSSVRRRVVFNFLTAITDEIVKTLERLTRRRSYKHLTEQSGNLGERWDWFLNGRQIDDPSTVGVLKEKDQLWIVSNLPYGVRAQKLTRAALGKSILSIVAGTLRRNRLFKEYKFFSIYPEIDGHRRPAISIKIRQGAGRRIIGE